MTVFENIKSKNIDGFAEWLNEHGKQDYAPWDIWFDKLYCDKCEPIVKHDPNYDNNGLEHEYCWCELHDGKCKFFQDMDEAPWGKQIVKMWLESEE